MSLDSRLRQLAVDNGLPVTPIILEYLTEFRLQQFEEGVRYWGRSSHLKVRAYRVIEERYSNKYSRIFKN